MAKKIELLHTTYDESGNIESQEVVHPLTSPDCIIMENGKTLDEVMGDGIATPTLTHEGTSFKVGVGDSNIEVVDGDVAGMTLKGQSYQNILPKPTTLIMETDEKEFKINDKIDSNIIIDDNIAEIATVKGKTIVNAVQEESGSEYTVLGEDLSGQSIAHVKDIPLVNIFDGNSLAKNESSHYRYSNGVLENISSGDGQNWDNKSDVCNGKMKPNTKYIILVENVGNYEAKIVYNQNESLIVDIGQKKYNITTIYTNTVFRLKMYSHNSSNITKCKIMILEYQEGMENWNIPFFEGDEYYFNIKGITLQGQTLVNTIQEPCKDDYVVLGADDSIEIGAETGGHGTIEDTIGGSIKSAILKGQTLVNMFGNSRKTLTPTALYWNVGSSILNVKPNTKYFVKIKSNYRLDFKYRTPNQTIKEITDTNSQTFTFTSSSDTDIVLITRETNVEYVVDVIMLEYQDGIENWDISYFDGMQSVKMPVLKTTGKNLFDIKNIDKIYQSTNNLTNQYKIRLKPNTNYTMSSNVPRTATANIYFNGTKTDVNGVYINAPKTAMSDNDGNLFFYIRVDDLTGIKLENFINNDYYIQLEEGSNATSYEPFKSNILTVNEDVELRGIGDVRDELDLLTGELTQRIGEVVLDGSEDEKWILHQISSYTTHTRFEFSLKGNKKPLGIVRTELKCDRFTWIDGDVETEHIKIDGGDARSIFVYIQNSKLTTQDVNGLKSWLQTNPLTIQYILETPTIKTVDLTVTDQDGNTIPHIQTQPTVTHITASSEYLIPTVTIDSNLTYDTIIKPSTLYTVRFKHDTVNADNPLTVDLGGTVQTVTSTEFTITTPSELTHNQLVFSGKNNVVSEVQVIEGDVTNIEYPFFEGMNDVKSPKLYATGKNLLDEKNIQLYSKESKKIIVTENIATSATKLQTIKLEKGDYTLSVSNIIYDGTTPIEFGFYDFNNSKWKFNSALKIMNRHYMTFSVTETGFYDFALYKHGVGVLNEFETNIQIEKGSTATSYEPYRGVEVQQDVDSIPLTSDMFEQNGHSFNSTSLIKGMSLQQIPLFNSDTRIKTKTLIKLKPNSTYTINADMSFSYACFNKDGNYLKAFDFCSTFTTDSETHYIAMNLKYADESAITPSDLDSMNLTLQEVPQEIVLRGIGDVRDKLDLTRGEYIQRIGEIVFDGSKDENWHIDTAMSNLFGLSLSPTIFNAYHNGTNLSVVAIFINDKYNQINVYTNYDANGLTIHSYSSGGGYAFIRDGSTNVVTFRQNLQSNPVKIQYILKTPIIHKVNLTNTKVIQSYATETHYETITPSDSLIPNITIPSTLNYNVAIKPSTEYTIRANTSDNLTVDLGGATGTLSNGKVTLTTPATLTHNEVKFSGTGKVKELMVVEGNEIKDNVPFFNGMKNVQMGGIKLVNIARGATCNSLVTANANKTQFTYTGDGSSWGYIWFDTSLFKPNTKYTLYVKVTKDNGTDTSGSIKWEIGNNSGQYSHNIVNYIGVYKKAIISIDENLILENHLILAFRPTTSGNQVVIQNPMIIEGDWTHLDEIPFIESEMIIEQPIIRSQGKNLFDINKVAEHSSIVKDGNTLIMTRKNPNDRDWVKVDIPLPKGTYTFSCSGVDGMIFRFSAFTYDNVEIYSWQKFNQTYTFNTDIAYLKISTETIGATYNVTNIQIEEGSTATTYEPFKHQTLYSNRVIGYEENCYHDYRNGNKDVNTTTHSVVADVDGLSIAYVTNVSSNITFFDKDGVFISGKAHLDTSLNMGDKNGFVTVPTNAKYMRFASYNLPNGNTHYTKATVTGELPLRSLPNGVCDTLNLVTGEYVQRVGEVVLDGISHTFTVNAQYSNTNTIFLIINSLKVDNYYDGKNCLCRELPSMEGSDDIEHIRVNANGNIVVWLNRNKFKDITANSIKEWLSQNPITVQYELETPIVRKLGFTTKGNYKEIELNGSENWGNYNRATGLINTVGYSTSISDSLNLGETEIYNVFAEEPFSNIASLYSTDAEGCNFKLGILRVSVKKSRLDEVSSTGFKRYVSLNPFKIGYISTAQSATSYSNILKPIFFNNVKVQFMNDNVDIQPTLTLQARTKNSYVMDMMKANTTYTMKCLAYSNSAKLYVANSSANTSVSSNKTLQFAQSHLDGSKNELVLVGQWYEPMIIEGDVTGKNLPYFKGILSSYHDVNEIEAYSVNKNLFDIKGSVNEQYDFMLNIPVKGGKNYIKDNVIYCVDDAQNNFGSGQKIKCKPNTKYYISFHVENLAQVGIHLSNKSNVVTNAVSTFSYTTPNDCYEFLIAFYRHGGEDNGTHIIRNLQIEESSTSTSYIPHAHNTTLIEMPTRLETVKVVRPKMISGAYDGGNFRVPRESARCTDRIIPVKPGMILIPYNNDSSRVFNYAFYDLGKHYIKSYTHDFNGFNGSQCVVPNNAYYVGMYCGVSNTDNISIVCKEYKPIQLNSLPNGVYDEIIMKPNSNKAQLVQRVGKVVLDGSEDWLLNAYRENTTQFVAHNIIKAKNATRQEVVCDKLQSVTDFYTIVNDSVWIYKSSKLVIHHSSSTSKQLKDWLKQNPLTVYYELAEPVITEIRLKGYPHVYENGTVTLNTDTPHQTLVSYNVNQEQLINTQNETIIRHDQQIDDLYYYIEMYLEEIYQMELFRMKLELSL